MRHGRVVHRRPAQRLVPLGYLAIAMAIAVLILPSVLRPPQDLQSSTTAFSPDAPPEDTPPEVLLQALRKAQSSTAGAAVEEVTTEEVVAEELAPPVKRRAGRGRCFGDPPRQTESLYSHRCVPAWTGTDNGGHTAPGVYGEDIRMVIAVGQSSESREGPLGREFRDDDLEGEHHLKVWQTYFNDRFEFYGRYLQFYILKMSLTDEDQMRAAVQKAKQEWDAFAMVGTGGTQAAAVLENVRQQIIDFGSLHNPWHWYNEFFPYAYSFVMDSDQTIELMTEIACKHLVGQPPGSLNARQDPTFNYNEPRVWGAVIYQDPTRRGAADLFRQRMGRCGAEIKTTAEYNLSDNQAAIAGIMGKMKAAGVTTVLLGADPIVPVVLTHEAERLQYYPEWIHSGTAGLDGNGAGEDMEDNQVTHMIGISPSEIPRPAEDRDSFRAYKEVDPDGDPSSSHFRNLQQIAGGIQHAGPNLTPLTFWDGLSKQPFREPNPSWSMGGGYRITSDFFLPGKDLTYIDFATLIWFDQGAEKWCHLYGGSRYKVGNIPTEPISWFDTKQCIFEPKEKGVQG